MANLEELSLKSSSTWAMSDIIGRILENVEKESPQLVNLELNGHFPDNLTNRHSMLKHLHKLSILNVSRLSNKQPSAQMIKQLINLKELTWPFDTPSELQRISGNLQSLDIGRCLTFPRMSYGRLTSLTLTCPMVFVQDRDVVDLPCLRDLTFSGYRERFILLRAPLLTNLNLKRWDLQGDRDPTWPVWCHPRSLTMDYEVTEESMIELLAGIGSEVEEIHWVCSQAQAVLLGRKLTIALSGSKHDAPLCPHLCHLTMNATNPFILNKSKRDRVELRLRAIIRERQCYGKGLHIEWLEKQRYHHVAGHYVLGPR